MIQLTATDADDPTYGNSARVVYSILEGQPYFSVDAKTGMTAHMLNPPPPPDRREKLAFLWFLWKFEWVKIHQQL